MQLFKSKPAPEPPAPPVVRGPLRQTLDAHLQKEESINAQRRTLAERQGALGADIERANKCAQELHALTQKIDAMAVAAAIADTAPVDLTKEREALAQLTRKHEVLEQRASIARAARQELQTKSDTLYRDEYKPLWPQINRALLDALLEEIAALHPALMQAQAAFLAIHRQVFRLAFAIDQHSASNQLGVFVGADRFAERFVPLPHCAPFEPLHLSDLERGQFEARRREQSRADYFLLEREAQALIGRLLRGEDADEKAN